MESQIPPFGSKGMESNDIIATSWSVEQEGSSPIGLNLELGRGSSGQKLDGKRSSFLGFTILQLQELQLQALIYKYIEAGLPVPYHLVLPIWQSFSSSFGNLPSSIGISSMGLDSRRGIEAEPWRCRRTDGKKWRCGKEALPHQKYCGRHIHRGRHRSRKLVDSTHYNTSPNNAINIAHGTTATTATTTSNNIMTSDGGVNIGSNLTNLSISLPVNNTGGALFPSFGFSSRRKIGREA